MSLGTNATMEQSGLVSVVVGAGAAWFGFIPDLVKITNNTDK